MALGADAVGTGTGAARWAVALGLTHEERVPAMLVLTG